MNTTRNYTGFPSKFSKENDFSLFVLVSFEFELTEKCVTILKSDICCQYSSPLCLCLSMAEELLPLTLMFP